nr:hypothetical protein [Bacteroidota bacterium]
MYGLANYGLLSAQTDSLFYYLDKATLTNNVLAPFNDTTYWDCTMDAKTK